MTSPSPLLAAVMIVKNEERHLERCLRSIAEACDEIIIVDTGSTDTTLSIAEFFGARIFHREWNNDFAAARNESLEHTNAQWVLYIDADEMLVNVNVPQLRALLTQANNVAAFGLQLSPMIGWLPYTDFRLWRHDPSIRFTGDIHETTLPDIRRLAEERNQTLEPISLHMQHFGYEGDQTTKRLRNLPLLEKQRQRTPRKINILNQLARIQYELGNFDEAEQVWLDALRIIREDGEKEVTDVTVFAPYADLLMNKGVDAEAVIAEGMRFRSDYLILHLAAARNHFTMRRYTDAIHEARILLSYADRPPFDSRFAYNMHMFSLWPQQILAESLYLLGNFAEARFAYGNAVAMGTQYEQVRDKIRRCEEFIPEFAISNATQSGHSLERVDLSDATFLIPLRIDSGDRLRNVIAVCEWLSSTFATRVLIGHADPEKIQPLLPASVDCISIDDDDRYPFHSTRIFNALAHHVTTHVLIQYDADVLIPADQMMRAVEHVRNDNRSVVYPYTYWNSIPADEIDEILIRPIDSSVRCGFPRSTGDPVGGCVVRSTEGFFAYGMDNEYFIGWNSEDKERHERALRLGFDVSRVDGPLFHLDHAAVRHQSDIRQFHQLGEAERARLQALNDAELRDEIASWPWVHKTEARPVPPVYADDLTITIPIEVDSRDRLQNLITCTNALLQSITAPIVVGTSRPDDISPHLDPRVTVLRLDVRDDGLFHHTKMLNDLATYAKTNFIANLDCDIVVLPDQWQATLNALRNESADMVYPYDGEMIQVPASYVPWLEQGRFDSMPRALRNLMHSHSVGGCVVWRRQAFLDFGMENEHFVSWGFEDDERLARAQTLGLRIHRIPGPVFHLHHPRGANSTGMHPFYEKNQQELQRISSMSSTELRTEVQTWPWRQQALQH